MFDPNSRYIKIPTSTWVNAQGQEIRYVRRRFLPQSESLPLLTDIAVTQGERLDLIAARTIGDPEQFWRTCDASNAMNPSDLLAEVGRIVQVPIPQPQ